MSILIEQSVRQQSKRLGSVAKRPQRECSPRRRAKNVHHNLNNSNKNKTEDKALPLFQRHFKWQHTQRHFAIALRVFMSVCLCVCVCVFWFFVYANVNSNRNRNNNNSSTRNLLLRYFFSVRFLLFLLALFPPLHAVCVLCVCVLFSSILRCAVSQRNARV